MFIDPRHFLIRIIYLDRGSFLPVVVISPLLVIYPLLIKLLNLELESLLCLSWFADDSQYMISTLNHLFVCVVLVSHAPFTTSI